jgi:hypothetical protein
LTSHTVHRWDALQIDDPDGNELIFPLPGE